MSAPRFAMSKDGTRIGYYQVGRGPGLVLLHGIMESASSHMELAEALSDSLTVYLPERRGRGVSGPYGERYGLQTEIEDLAAVLEQTRATSICGISLGALLALEAARADPSIRKAALFDPPLSFDGSVSTHWLKRFDEEMTRGDIAAALVTSMLGTRLGPPIFHRLPRRLLVGLTKLMLAGQEKNAAAGDEIPFGRLAATIPYDVGLVDEIIVPVDRYDSMGTDFLLMGGDRSPAYMKDALHKLEKLLPGAQRIEFTKLGHEGAGNRSRRGQPDRIARELRNFFLRGECS
ncbi:alpha/beta hydrolase [Paenibacillus antri]|uniref:Alpha/beta hydrolase n=1 Tax=Paenibacillus antri TaxID=2582848 RepID=A0A5R9G2S7_9BACL|nr:alpha/beta hydrolase [Paenibacillus antri]TLS49319.1 alpha/beta hydrolase [Paenibacillus antri]